MVVGGPAIRPQHVLTNLNSFDRVVFDISKEPQASIELE